jgi:iron complex transport system substrate-binding protein
MKRGRAVARGLGLLGVVLCLVLGAAAQARPARVVCLIPAVTEMLFAMGAGGEVVAVGSFDRHPPEVAALPRVGALLDPDVEKILSLRPDLVVVYGSQKDLRAQLDRAGIAQFVYTHGGLADAFETMRQLGARLDRRADADRLVAELQGSLDAIRKRVAGRRRPRTLLVFGREPGALRGIYASGGTGFLHDMLEIAGGVNVLADLKREAVQTSSETVIARRPEVIVELRTTGASAERDAWKALTSVPAVRYDRIEVITDELVTIPGPRVAQGVEMLARAIHPGAFR